MLGLLASAGDGDGNAWVLILVLLGIAWFVAVVVGWWKVFEKAGEAGWKALIPIYNAIVILRIVGLPAWMVIGLLIPFVNIIVFVIVMGNLAASFGKGIGYTVGLVLLSPVFAVMLGFGSATYLGPAAASRYD